MPETNLADRGNPEHAQMAQNYFSFGLEGGFSLCVSISVLA